MALGPEHYAGREQAYVKHFLLGHYFSDLVHKVAGRFDEIVYVDGFSGPWQSEQDDLGDTSFGIALDAMRSAKAAWRKNGRNVEMHALLVERNKKAFQALESVPAKYPEIKVRPYNGEFVPVMIRSIHNNIREEVAEIGPNVQGCFAIKFIDTVYLNSFGVNISSCLKLSVLMNSAPSPTCPSAR
jgi:three-Cys-motif partner protein